jgi:hypothetical protein
LTYPLDAVRLIHLERLAAFDSPEARFRREWAKQSEIDRLKARLTRAREAHKVATAQ